VTAYATASDLYTYALRRGVLSNPGREVESSSASTNVITLDQHLFETNDEVTLRAAEGGTLSAPLVEGTVYYVVRLTDSTFSVAATSGGAAINLTTDGVSMMVKAELPVAALLEAYSRFVDDFIPAHLVPLDSPYPVTIVRIVCELTAAKLLSLAGQSSVSMTEAEVGAKAQLERWSKGVPIRDATVTASANRAIVSTLASTADPRGWAPSGSGSIP
jgi:hypothetical protein